MGDLNIDIKTDAPENVLRQIANNYELKNKICKPMYML